LAVFFKPQAMCSKRITRICQCLAEVPIEAGVAALAETALSRLGVRRNPP
jgi:hypothetical protein